jgi:predicted MFS family arabinose efflux permease
MQQRRVLATMFAIVFADLVGFGIVIPLLPLYADHFSPPGWVFGLLMASYSAMQFLFAPILGRLSDRVGRRPVLLISLAGSIAGFVLFALADSLALLFVSRLLAGACGGNVGTAQAVIADVTPREHRARGMGMIGAAFGLGFIAGPGLAGLLLPLGASAPGWGAAACSALAWLATAAFLPETRPAGGHAGGPRSGVARIAAALRRPELAPLLAVSFCAIAGFAAFEVTFAQFLHGRLGLDHRHVSFFFVYIGVLAVLIQGGLVGPMTRRLGERRLLLGGLGAIAAGLGLLATAHRTLTVAFLLPVLSLGTGMTMPSLSALVSHTAAADEQGLALGAYQGVGSLARVLGPFVAQVVLAELGLAAPALLAAALAAVALLAAATLVRKA